jgi:plastocyanin
MKRAAILLSSVMVACSSGTTGTDGGTDAPSSNDSASNPDVGTVNMCTTFTDDTTSAAPAIMGPTDANPAQYTPNCIHIKVGQSVTWTSDFSAHPLEQAGGSSGSPIQTTMMGTTVSFTFSSPGTFGFNCMVHPGIMFGAVEVTP